MQRERFRIASSIPEADPISMTAKLIDGKAISASLFDLGLYCFHNLMPRLAQGKGTYFYLPKLENSNPQIGSAPQDVADSSIRGGGVKHRPNIALARSRESRPVFGQGVPAYTETSNNERKIERFVMSDTEPFHPAKQETSWTSWIAGFALVCMLLETGYKEYRRWRTNSALEQERRL